MTKLFSLFMSSYMYLFCVLFRWCLGFSILSQSRIGRVCVVQVCSFGSYLWLQWIRSEQKYREKYAWLSGMLEILYKVQYITHL